MKDAVFVYRKDQKFRVLNLDAPRDASKKLLDKGWNHIATLSASTWLEGLFNSQPEKSNDYIEDLLFKDI